MSFKLEDLDYQQTAIDSAVRLFDGQQRNIFLTPFQSDVHANVLSLTPEEIAANVAEIATRNGIAPAAVCPSTEPDFCVEMETGTGKTLVYLKTIYELARAYGLSKFIILVPSVPIREGVLDTISSFEPQLERIYRLRLHAFEYDSRKLTRLKHFISGTDLQVMVMTTQSFNSDDRIINQTGRDDGPEGLSYWQALGQVRPVVIMDEPQEGMDTENVVARLAELNCVARLRYSATHKIVRNLVYQLSPIEAYNQRLVKKIEVLSVAERNDEATLKLELAEIQTGKGDPKVKLRAWRRAASGFKWGETKWLKARDNLAAATGNSSYLDFTIDSIRAAGLRGGTELVRFSNGVELTKSARSGDFAGIFRLQLYWLCRRHFEKRDALLPRGIKPLSLVFIDRVANFLGDNPLIRNLFREEFPKAWQDHYGAPAPAGHADEVQGYYFATTRQGEYTDNENTMATQKEIYDEILRDKEALLSFDNPRQFIFSHSALGVGWDNPNVFNIATLNQSFSDAKKRQEIGRGLRICRNAAGERVHDNEKTPEGEEINLLTVIPNESYESFVRQYQQEIGAGITPRHNPAGKGPKQKQVRLNRTRLHSDPFRRFWQSLSRKTDYSVRFDEHALVEKCIVALDSITVPRYTAVVELNQIQHFSLRTGADTKHVGSEEHSLAAVFSPVDLVEEISENTRLAYPTVLAIVGGLSNLDQVVRNPPRWLHEAVKQIKRIELEEMLRTIDYRPTGESFSLDLFKDVIPTFREVVPTPHRGIYDHVIVDSSSAPEKGFARDAEADPRVVCVLKLPDWYEIPTPIGPYTPDFGIVVTHSGLRDDGCATELHLVVETKSTSDPLQLDETERLKIECAVKHFNALGLAANTSLLFRAPATHLAASLTQDDQAAYRLPDTNGGYFGPTSSQGPSIRESGLIVAYKTGTPYVGVSWSPECQEIRTRSTTPRASPKASRASLPSTTRAPAGAPCTISARSSSWRLPGSSAAHGPTNSSRSSANSAKSG